MVVAAAVGGGMPLLTACGGGSGGAKNEGTTTGKKLKDILPAYVPSKAVTPDIPSKNGSADGFTTALPADQLAVSVPKKLGQGSELRVMAPLWGTSPGDGNPYWKAMDEAAGVTVKWQNQDGNVYGQKLGAVLASSDIPDAVVVPGWELGGKIPSAIANKFADLGPYLSGDKVKDYPNLAAIPTGAWQRAIFSRQAARSPHRRPRRRRTSRPSTARTSSRRRGTRSPPPRRSSTTSARRSTPRRARCGRAAT